MSGHPVLVHEERLSLADQVKLVEIAHETDDAEVREFALNLLRSHCGPRYAPGMAYPINIDTGEMLK